MPQRRAFFGLVAAPLVCAWPAAAQAPSGTSGKRPTRPAGYFPNVVLRTHDGERVRFYDDLVKGRVVAINFMFTNCKTFCPRVTANLRRVYELLGDRVGRDVFFVSITVDPATDTPAVLKEYVTANNIGKGWVFVTGAATDIELIRRKLGVWDRDGDDMTDHTGLLTYGNDATGSWAATPVINKPSRIATALKRVIVRPAAPAVSLDSARIQ
jgi:protein SCO1